MKNRLLGCLAVLGVAGVLAPASAMADCRAIYDEVQAAGNAASLAVLKDYYDRSLHTADCDDAFRAALGRKVSGRIVAGIEKALAGGASAASQKGQLEESLVYFRNWQVLAMLGDIEAEVRDNVAATTRYQDALNVIDDDRLTPNPPPAAVIRKIFKKAETQRLLAPTYVRAPRNRAGAPTGLGACRTRGFVVKKVAVPITFKFDSVEFDAKGVPAAKDLIEQLRSCGSPKVTLVGHTDASGEAGYNLSLSQKRAAAVRDYLKSAGYSGQIAVQGRGENEPFSPDDPKAYGQDERDRMNRRVELLK